MFPEIDLIVEVWVQTGVFHACSEHRLVGPRGAGCYNNPVELMFPNCLLDVLLPII
jgi:hypothetical protein